MKLLTYLGLLVGVICVTLWLSLSVFWFVMFVCFGNIIFSEDFTSRKISEILGFNRPLK